MKRKIRLSKCSLNNKEIKSVVKHKVWFLGMGPNVNKFEKNLRFFCRNTFVFQVNLSFTYSIRKFKFKFGDQVILSSLNYVAAYGQ